MPAVVGVPLSKPVLLLSVRPAGNVPPLIPQTIGVVPVAVNVNEYAVPTNPLGGVLLVIVGGVPAARPVPLKLADPVKELIATLSVPDAGPATVGANKMVNVHVAVGATGPVHPFVPITKPDGGVIVTVPLVAVLFVTVKG